MLKRFRCFPSEFLKYARTMRTDVTESRKRLDNNDACNAAWRLALRNLDGTEAAACKNATAAEQ